MQVNRLFEIIYILLDKKSVTAKELAERFEVSQRTIYRDIETLSGAGIPVYMRKGNGGGISLLPEFILNKTVITEEEKEDILSSLKAIGTVKLGAKDTTLRKLGSLFGETNSDWIEVDFGSWSDGDKEAVLFATIKEAIIEKTVICFSYASVKGEISEREVEPLKLCFKGGAWYLYGYCRKRKDNRFFKLKRIRMLEKTEESCVRTCTKTVLKESGNPITAEKIKLKLKISKEAAFRIYDEFESYERLEDGSFLVEVELPKNDWLLYYVLSYGRYCEVLEPEEIRKWVRKELERILKQYD